MGEHTYTVIDTRGDEIRLREGCCGAVIRVPVSDFPTPPELEEEFSVQAEVVLGLSQYEILIDGNWISVE